MREWEKIYTTEPQSQNFGVDGTRMSLPLVAWNRASVRVEQMCHSVLSYAKTSTFAHEHPGTRETTMSSRGGLVTMLPPEEPTAGTSY